MSDKKSKYQMTISLNVLKHLGLNLYSNTPAVLAEVIANAWDADAENVDVNFDTSKNTVDITDDGCGMDLQDVNEKYLYVGYEKRKKTDDIDEVSLTKRFERLPMGRKGIGKLSLFSIANRISVYTHKEGAEAEAFELNAIKLEEAIKQEDPFKPGLYEPDPISPEDRVPTGHGTCIRITELKKVRLTQTSVNALRRRLARRFSILGDEYSFHVSVNGERISLSERDYFHKARFLYQYGNDYEPLCRNLDKQKEGEKLIACAFNRENRFNTNGVVDEAGPYQVKGWIAIAKRSNDLDGGDDDEEDNLNRITVVSRGKVAQEDILQEFRLGGMITKYMFGEIEADFLDEDLQPDIATSSRQRFSEEDERYRALTKFVRSELEVIWKETNKLKERTSVQHALTSNPKLKQWYENLRPARLKSLANKIFTDIDKAGIEESERQQAYSNGVLLFEHLKLNHVTELIKDIDVTEVDEFLQHLREADALEAEHYRQIVTERLNVIEKLQSDVDDDVLEKVLQEYLFDHLFLLDPSWERATESAEMEKRMERIFKEGKLRADIQYTKYRRVAAAHVIVELKRSSALVDKTDLEKQVKGYMHALRTELQQHSSTHRQTPIEGICVVGRLPPGWEDETTRIAEEESLRAVRIRVVTYRELIDNARAAYGSFIAANESHSELNQLIREIGEHQAEP